MTQGCGIWILERGLKSVTPWQSLLSGYGDWRGVRDLSLLGSRIGCGSFRKVRDLSLDCSCVLSGCSDWRGERYLSYVTPQHSSRMSEWILERGVTPWHLDGVSVWTLGKIAESVM